jgi:hypothetical protein
MISILRTSVLDQDSLTPDPFPGLLLNPVQDSDKKRTIFKTLENPDFSNERFLKPLENPLALQAALWIRDILVRIRILRCPGHSLSIT